jgi:hypothetical protein
MSEFETAYDQAADVLYVTTGANGPALAEEDEDGLVWRRSVGDGALVGLTVVDFAEVWQARLPTLIGSFAQRFSVPEPAAQAVFLGVKA